MSEIHLFARWLDHQPVSNPDLFGLVCIIFILLVGAFVGVCKVISLITGRDFPDE